MNDGLDPRSTGTIMADKAIAAGQDLGNRCQLNWTTDTANMAA